MSFRVRVWGCRGSVPTPGEATVRFGGNTPCVEVRTGDGALLILDAGTGLRRLGAQLEWDAALHVLVTHLHGNAPQVSVESGRKMVPNEHMPTFLELEEAVQSVQVS